MKLLKYLLLMSLAAVVTMGCDDDPEDITPPERGTMKLRIVNASDAYAEVDFYTEYLNEESPLALGLKQNQVWPASSHVLLEAINQAEFNVDEEVRRKIFARTQIVDAAGDTTAIPIVSENVDGLSQEAPLSIRMSEDTTLIVYLYRSFNEQKYLVADNKGIPLSPNDTANSVLRLVNLSPTDTVTLSSDDTLYSGTTRGPERFDQSIHPEIISGTRTLTLFNPDSTIVYDTHTIDMEPGRAYVLVYSQAGTFSYEQVR